MKQLYLRCFQITAALGLVCAAGTVSIFLWLYHDVDWKVLTVCVTIPALAMIVSFLIPWLVLARNTAVAKAICFEAGMQNVPTAIAFVLVSFSGPVLGEIIPPLFFTGLFGLFDEVAVVGLFRVVKLARNRKLGLGPRYG